MFAATKAGILKRGLQIQEFGPEYSILEQKSLRFVGVAVERFDQPMFMGESGPHAISLAIVGLHKLHEEE